MFKIICLHNIMTAMSPKNKNAYTKLGKLSKDQKFSLHNSILNLISLTFSFIHMALAEALTPALNLKRGTSLTQVFNW